MLREALQRLLNRENIVISSYNKAIDWIKDNTIPEQGIIATSGKRFPYPEVTGYLIPTLIDCGEYKLAEQYAEFLAYIQHPNGAFSYQDGRQYFFDSGQVLRGLLKASRYWDRFKPLALNTAEYLMSYIKEDGRIPSIYEEEIPEYVHVFVLPVLTEAADFFNRPEYLRIIKKSIDYYKNCPDVLNNNLLNHFLAYIVDGFIDMGEADFVYPTVKNIFSSQQQNGSIPAKPNVRWTCSSGTAQLAIIGYKLGLDEQADKAVNYLCRIQNRSGGFYGSYGFGAKYFSDQEISWANKFFIDAVHLKILRFFDRHANIFPPEISSDDARLKEVFDQLGDLENKKVLDAGCGKGRFATKVKARFPSCEIYGIDVSEELLKEAPDSIIKKKGSILNLPYDSGVFDGIFCIEALGYAIRPQKAIEELCRVLKDNAKIVIIDKNIKKLDKREITDFEQWFDKDKIKNILKKYCRDVQAKEIAYGSHEAVGLFFSWSGIKGSEAPDSKKWHDLIVEKKSPYDLARKINNNDFPAWCKPLLQYSFPNDSMLELGSGSGELSAILGIHKRVPHLLEYSQENINFTKALFKELDIKGYFYYADVLQGISLGESSIDWVWSSGLLEHFTDEQIDNILKDSVRVSKKGVMSLVPNANSIFYRLGKFNREQNGAWRYGLEEPKFSMKDYFEKAGLRNIEEYSVGVFHSLTFWGKDKKKDIQAFYHSLGKDELKRLNQGYLLFTYGEK